VLRHEQASQLFIPQVDAYDLQAWEMPVEGQRERAGHGPLGQGIALAPQAARGGPFQLGPNALLRVPGIQAPQRGGITQLGLAVMYPQAGWAFRPARHHDGVESGTLELSGPPSTRLRFTVPIGEWRLGGHGVRVKPGPT